ncbi:MAG: hypothetical protein A2Y14_01035 [Verrucomicrobia bacterium GWF2_51_19]|nr:MAG: hypothetical protein A2Y14_01035 [Verrucomicrobia bacterium GWF2_51_19]HCJ12067.1 hypothetical protein [Opitutae bacterium]
MDSNLHVPQSSVRGASKAKQKPAMDVEGQKVQAESDTTVPSSIQSARDLLNKIKSIPDNRPEMIELGKRLLSDDTYPSAKQLRSVASQLLKDLSEEVAEV